MPDSQSFVTPAPVRHCVLVLPQKGEELPQGYSWGLTDLPDGSTLFMTPIVGEALGFESDVWTIVAPQEWQAAPDEAFEAVRVQDVARALAAAATLPSPPALVDMRCLPSDADSVAIITARASQNAFGNSAGAGALLPPELAMYNYGLPELGVSAVVNWTYFQYLKPPTLRDDFSVNFAISGRGRLLLWGPHISLSPGLWILRARIKSRKHGGIVSLNVEWGDMKSFTTLDCDIVYDGVHELAVGHHWIKASPCELRVTLAHPIFDCDLEISDIRLERG